MAVAGGKQVGILRFNLNYAKFCTRFCRKSTNKRPTFVASLLNDAPTETESVLKNGEQARVFHFAGKRVCLATQALNSGSGR